MFDFWFHGRVPVSGDGGVGDVGATPRRGRSASSRPAAFDLQSLDVEGPCLAAGLPLAPSDGEPLVRCQEAKRGAHDVARVRLTSARHVVVDERFEALAEGEGSGHGNPRFPRVIACRNAARALPHPQALHASAAR